MSVTILHKIPLSEQTVKRLKALAEPLEDTYDSVVARLLDSFDRGGGDAAERPQESKSQNFRECDPFAPPSLTHTKVTFASLEGESIGAPNWNKILDKALSIAMERSHSFSAVQKIATVNLREGKRLGAGYHFLPGAGFSVQGQDASDAWRGIAHICRTLGLVAEVHFLWRVKEGATFPGMSGVFKIPPRT
jgi:hypothetical protein